MKKNDIKLIVVLILITSFIFIAFELYNKIESAGNKNFNLVVSIGGETKKYIIDENRIIKLKNKIKIQIKNKKVKIISSPCKNKICMRRGEINKLHQNIICLPCKTIIYIEKSSKNKNDKFDSFVE